MKPTLTRLLAGLGLTLAIAGIADRCRVGAQSPSFFDDDPIWVDRDTEDASGMKPLEVNLFVDLTYNMIKGAPPSSRRPREEPEHRGRGARLELVHQPRRPSRR